MAAITARSAKKSVSYHDLYNLSTADLLFDEKKNKRRPASKSLGLDVNLWTPLWTKCASAAAILSNISADVYHR